MFQIGEILWMAVTYGCDCPHLQGETEHPALTDNSALGPEARWITIGSEDLKAIPGTPGKEDEAFSRVIGGLQLDLKQIQQFSLATIVSIVACMRYRRKTTKSWLGLQSQARPSPCHISIL